MKRSPLTRRSGLKTKPRPRRSQTERQAALEFKTSVSWPCEVCGRWPGYTCVAHHVVYKQHCPTGFEWDRRNALAICQLCHERHHSGNKRIPLDRLTDQNLEFAQEVLGEAAEGYLLRRYANGGSVRVANGEAAPQGPSPGQRE